ncbi:deoxyguanosinetriphosphate triphosphohydrolase [Herbiconiux moechotypicola]|uniref:Deoxyguanosinetriphosphate triphosphohydrolase-like protein n=1 Tax=Herbiconiux moechotypicola TaxID=637393 RepID=A0ABN3D704_9MICO|nr:deoxyguanosinetriphosphate triphosphohydrolase [Herbiconiux moechotypicola]MCS5728505.1 deoxyguanosinetriphosphate triphosphohydrolase [Herbiconiux moechotypicola]
MADPALDLTTYAPTKGYDDSDAERFLPEEHYTRRSDFARDRARVLHSSSLRRLAAKTQVLSPAVVADFARNRLTHSLEVAQVGRELAASLDLDPDVVDTACLAHDLGHPPFGHNGEKALNEWAQGIGGFEGNAQSLRILSRLEPKVVDDTGRSLGLNLTRASLDASCKYPWTALDPVPDPSGRLKYGVYDDDVEVFEWVRIGAPERRLCVEAQVMDLSDDIAYSVHDFEDAVLNGYIDVSVLGDRVDHDSLVRRIHARAGGFSLDELAAAFDRLDSLRVWISEWDDSRADHARLKNLTSQLIGRFAGAATRATREAFPAPSITRYGADVIVPAEVSAEIATLKGIVSVFVMSSDARQPLYVDQRMLLAELADALWESGGTALDTAFRDDWRRAGDDETAARRVVVDQVASLTDQTAVALHARLCRQSTTAEALAARIAL